MSWALQANLLFWLRPLSWTNSKKEKKAFPIIKSFPKTSPKFLYFFCLWSMLRFVCGLQTSTETVITLSPVDRLADKEYNKKYNLFMSHVKSWARRLIRKDWPLCCFANPSPPLNCLYLTLTPGKSSFHHSSSWDISRHLLSRIKTAHHKRFHYNQTISSRILLFDHWSFLSYVSTPEMVKGTCERQPGVFCRWAGGVGASTPHTKYTHEYSKIPETLLHLHLVSLLPSQKPGSSI